ncbi:MAG: carotenoid oxygenase family protein [bacterium]
MPDLNAGALAPVSDEFDTSVFKVTGEVPADLNGTLIRNGPNPFAGSFAGVDVLDWWPEAAMLHGITFASGEVTHYSNRWVRTQNYAAYKGEDIFGRVNSNPNVNVIEHAGEILALAEGGSPVRVNPSLETLGQSDLHPSLNAGVTAHPKIDAKTGELMCFRADWAAPYLTYGVLDREGQQSVALEVELTAPSMMHDMAITARHSILMDLNVGYDFSMFDEGYRIPISWDDQRTSRLCVLARDGSTMNWFDIEPCFIQHVVNACERQQNILEMDVVRYPWYFKRGTQNKGFQPNPLGVLWRYTLNLDQGTLIERQLDDLNIELPRINESYVGYPNRYHYAVVQPSDQEMRGVVCYDLASNNHRTHPVSPGDQNSEPIFVPKSGATTAKENDGYILVCVYRHATNVSEIRILDATDISKAPLATVALDRRIPAGFHGAWISADG